MVNEHKGTSLCDDKKIPIGLVITMRMKNIEE